MGTPLALQGQAPMVTRYDGKLRYSSAGGDVWATPPDFFAAVDKVCGFELDAAASASNALCGRFWTEDEDGLCQPWHGRTWCNPPYSKVRFWTAKAAAEFEAGNADLVVMLVPVRTSTRWWQAAVSSGARVAFVPGRLRFGSAANPAGFDSALLCWGVRLNIGKCAVCGSWFAGERNSRRTCSGACRIARHRNGKA